MDSNASFSRPGPRLVESLELLAHAQTPSERSPASDGRGSGRRGISLKGISHKAGFGDESRQRPESVPLELRFVAPQQR